MLQLLKIVIVMMTMVMTAVKMKMTMKKWMTWWPPLASGRGRTWRRWRWEWWRDCNLATAELLFSLEVYLIGVGTMLMMFVVKPVVELVVVVVLPNSSRQRRLLKLGRRKKWGNEWRKVVVVERGEVKGKNGKSPARKAGDEEEMVSPRENS